MSNSKPANRKSFASEAQYNSWYSKLVIASLLSFLLYKLFPYNFSQTASISFNSIISEFSQDGLAQVKDYVELFMSLLISALLGFGLAGSLRNRRVGAVPNFIIILLISTSLGLITELLQAVLPIRNPNLWDVLIDSLGGFLGWLGFYRWHSQLFYCASIAGQKSKRYLLFHCSLRKLATGFVAYFLIAALGVIVLPNATDLRNWNSSFALTLGNEQTGDRPWQGSIAQVQFFDRAMSQEEVSGLLSNSLLLPAQEHALLASYQLTEKRKSYPDRTGQLSELSWKGKPSETVGSSGIMLNSSHWLQTAKPAIHLNKGIQQNAQLTLDLILTPAALKQSGPARIVSLSQDALHRNFTIGQAGNNLVLRLRTPATGENGNNPEITVPRIFTDLSPHHLIITYANSRLQVYVDEIHNLYTFGLPHPSYKVLYYGWIFIPLGSLLGLILSLTRANLTARIVLLLSGIVLPTFLLEIFSAIINQRSFAAENLLLSQALMLGTLFIVKSCCDKTYEKARRAF